MEASRLDSPYLLTQGTQATPFLSKATPPPAGPLVISFSHIPKSLCDPLHLHSELNSHSSRWYSANGLHPFSSKDKEQGQGLVRQPLSLILSASLCYPARLPCLIQPDLSLHTLSVAHLLRHPSTHFSPATPTSSALELLLPRSAAAFVLPNPIDVFVSFSHFASQKHLTQCTAVSLEHAVPSASVIRHTPQFPLSLSCCWAASLQ